MPAVVPKARAAVGTLVFLALAPGIVAGFIPWLLTDWRSGQPLPHWLPLRIVGVALVGAGVLVLLEAFVRFVREGSGTPAPVAPTEQLVIGGLYRYVRNPMYLAVGAIIIGQGLALGRPVLLLYAAVFFAAVAAFVHRHEEPTLERQFGQRYEAYRRAVPGWLPRRKPWNSRRDMNLCEHAFVTSQGSPYMRFRRTLDGGNVTEALSAASELQFVALAEALELTLLLADGEPQR